MCHYIVGNNTKRSYPLYFKALLESNYIQISAYTMYKVIIIALVEPLLHTCFKPSKVMIVIWNMTCDVSTDV